MQDAGEEDMTNKCYVEHADSVCSKDCPAEFVAKVESLRAALKAKDARLAELEDIAAMARRGCCINDNDGRMIEAIARLAALEQP